MKPTTVAPFIFSLIVSALLATTLLMFAGSVSADELLPRRDVFVKPGVEPGGSGDIDDPYASIQEMVDRHDAVWGQAFLYPTVYDEDVDVHRGRFWFRPWSEKVEGALIRGSLTIRRPGTIIRGMNFESEGSAIILADGADGGQIQQNRFHAIGEGAAAIDVIGAGVSGTLIADNIVDLRDGDGEGRTGIRIRVGEGVRGIRLDHNQIAGCETGIELLHGEGYTDETNLLTSNRLIENLIGLHLEAPGVTVRRNTFRGNSQAGIWARAGATSIDANMMTGDARGIVCDGEDVELSSNVIVEVQEQAVEVFSGHTRLLHNTLQRASDSGVPLLEVAAGAEAEVRSNILAGPGELLSAAGGVTAVRNLYSHEAAVADEGAIVGDPGFVAPHNGDYRISAESPAAHQAASAGIGHDAAGIGRPWGESASIGAYEVEGERATREYFVAPDAVDGDGSADSPFGTVGAALALALPGDTIVLRPGDYSLGNTTITRSGAPGALITIRSELPHQARMGTSVFTLSDCSYVRIEGLDFTGLENRPIRCAAYVSHCEFVNNVFVREGAGGGGISIGGPGSSYNLIEDNLIALGGEGVTVGVSISPQYHNLNTTIRGNDISGCYYGVLGGGGSYASAPPGYHVIENNRIHNNHVDGIHPKGTDMIIRNNHIFENGNTGISTRSGARAVIVGNWIYENSRGIRLHDSSHFVINNVIANNRGNGILAFGLGDPHYQDPEELWIAHNTFWGHGGAPIVLRERSSAHILRNIFVGADRDLWGVQRASADEGRVGVARQVDANIYHQLRPPLLREYEGGRYDRLVNPMLRDPENGDFRPTDASPAWDVPQMNDALSAVLSSAPGGVPLPDHIGSNLGPMQ